MKLKVGVQLFSVMTELNQDYLQTMENVAKAGYQYVEYVAPRANGEGKTYTPEEIGNKLEELGLTAVGSHVNFDPQTVTHEDLVKIVEDNVKMHSKSMALAMSVMTTMDEIKKVAAACNDIGKLAKEHGMDFYYHNHAQEFYVVEGKTAYEWLMELTDPDLVYFEIDTFWAKRGGQKPVELIEKVGARAKLIHQKDMGTSADPINLMEGVTDLTKENFRDKIFARTNPTDICVVGTGTMEVPEIVEKVTELDHAQYIIVELDCCARETEEEYDTPLSPLASIKASREYLEKVIG
jgi:sugar phosphate isomerase/epimerase